MIQQEKQTVTSLELLIELRKLHPRNAWAFFEEMRLGTGYGGTVQQRLDAWAICLYPQKFWKKGYKAKYLRRSFEIKTFKADMVEELKNPDKRWFAYAYSHEFYFVVPKGLVDKKLLAKEDGLMEWDGENLRITKKPRVREAMPPRWSFVAAVGRRVQRETSETEQKLKEKLEIAMEALSKIWNPEVFLQTNFPDMTREQIRSLTLGSRFGRDTAVYAIRKIKEMEE